MNDKKRILKLVIFINGHISVIRTQSDPGRIRNETAQAPDQATGTFPASYAALLPIFDNSYMKYLTVAFMFLCSVRLCFD